MAGLRRGLGTMFTGPDGSINKASSAGRRRRRVCEPTEHLVQCRRVQLRGGGAAARLYESGGGFGARRLDEETSVASASTRRQLQVFARAREFGRIGGPRALTGKNRTGSGESVRDRR